MVLKETIQGLFLIREQSDPPLKSEAAVTRYLITLLNERDKGGWVRFYPYRHGLTACLQGVARGADCNRIYWHSNYQIETTYDAFNSGVVFYSIA
jgi:hypothetical protein